MKITPPKGRPMLYWVGKKPIERIKSFPTQLVEVFDPFSNTEFYRIPKYEKLEKDWHNLLFEGDNKEVLATLLELGFRGKVDLIYIDPPFASNKDYVRKVELKGFKGSKIENEEAPLLQQVMYEDIWKRDEYFQWIYERLLLMRALLSETGSIYVHLDWHLGHYVKIIMDEIFGEDNFNNEIIWRYRRWNIKSTTFNKNHDMILWYSKNVNFIFNQMYEPKSPKSSAQGQAWKSIFDENGRRRSILTGEPTKGVPMGDVWEISMVNPVADERLGFSTQKPEALLERIIKASSNENDLILDCFIGSGTTLAAAQKLGRRWIGVDINKGAVQLSSKRLSQIIKKQLEKANKLFKASNKKYFAFSIYKVNNYDLKLEVKDLAIKHLGIERTRTDSFFDGKIGNRLVKIIDFNHPLTLLDLESIKDELSKRKNEERDLIVVCYGSEIMTQNWIEDWNKKSPVNKIKIIDLRIDKEKGGFIVYSPPQATVKIERKGKNKASIKIEEFISPTVIKRFNMEQSVFQKQIRDFRSMIDFVLIDPNYDGKVFKVVYTDIPEKKKDLIKGEYEIEIPEDQVTVAVKIADVLGNEVLISKEV